MRAFIVTVITLILFTPLPVQSQPAQSPNTQSQTPQAQLPQLPTATPSANSRDLLQQGLNAQASGNYPQAESAYRAAIQLNEKDAIAHYNLANVLADQSKVTEAITTYRTAIELDPTNAKAHFNLGYWLSTQGETQPAITAYRTATRLNPFDADTYYNLSLLLQSQSAPTETDLTEAEILMNRAILLNPDYAL